MDKENIMVIEYMDNYGSCDFEMVAIYNREKISEEKVVELIKSNSQNSNVIKIDKMQYENIFGKLG